MNEDPDKPRIELGGPCPPIKSWFFPSDESLKPYELENKDGEDERPSQSA